MKILPVGAELLHADGQMDTCDKANSRFSQLCERARQVCQRNAAVFYLTYVCL